MHTIEEEKFILYWKVQRAKKLNYFKQGRLGLMISLFFVAGVFLNISMGWHKRAAMVLNTQPSFILVLLIALVLIIVFVTIMAARLRWERLEQRYQELLSKP